MLRLLNILPFLAFDAAGSTMDMIFAKIKAQAMGGASTSAALTLATFIVGVKMIRMAYNVFSDEQQGGFGGIRLIEVLRPILIVLAINVSGTMFGAMDSVVNYITGSVGKSFGVSSLASAYNKAAEEAVENWNISKKLQKELAGLGANSETIIAEVQKGVVDRWQKNVDEYTNKVLKKGYGGQSAYEVYGSKDKAEREGREAGLKEVERRSNELASMVRQELLMADANFAKLSKEVDDWYSGELKKQSESGGDNNTPAANFYNWDAGNLQQEYEKKKTAIETAAIAAYGGEAKLKEDVSKAVTLYRKAAGQDAASKAQLADTEDLDTKMLNFFEKLTQGVYFRMAVNWIYDALYFAVKTFADIGLIMLALIFPWILCLSLLDFFKQAVWQFFATYLSLSMYKVVASGINWIICSASVAMSTINISAILPTLTSSSSKMTCLLTELSIKAVLYAAGAIAMTKTGSLVSMMIPGGASTGDFGGGGAAIATGALSKGTAAAKNVMGTAKGFATGQSGIQQAIKGKKSGKATQEFQQNVTNALGKLTGNSGSNNGSGS